MYDIYIRHFLQGLSLGITCFGSTSPRWCKAEVEYIRVNICTIRPCESSSLDSHHAEQRRVISNRLEDGTLKVWLQIDFSLRTIGKINIDHKSLSWFNALNSY